MRSGFWWGWCVLGFYYINLRIIKIILNLFVLEDRVFVYLGKIGLELSDEVEFLDGRFINFVMENGV